MVRRRALLLVNHRSRSGQAGFLRARELLGDHGIEFIDERPQSPAALCDAIRQHSRAVDLIVLGGGDGTLNGAAAALLEADRPVGVLPLGTANDLARTLGIPTALEDACQVIVEGNPQRIDLGQVNDRYFFNVASIGLSVQVTKALTHQVKRRWGSLGYGVAMLDAIRHMRPFRAEVHCDGRTTQMRTVQIAVGNGRHYGGGMTIAAEATIDDHELHLYSLPPQSLGRMLLRLPVLRRGPVRDDPGLRLLQGRRILVRTRRPMPVNTDGEITTRTPAEFKVLPAVLSVMVPRTGIARG